MRYAQGGGLDARARAVREVVRRQAVQLLAQGLSAAQVAVQLRVTPQAVRRWRRLQSVGGDAALSSAGAPGPECRLDAAQLAELGRVLEAGPAASGWVQDQRWTLARVCVVVRRLFGVRYSLKGMSLVLHRAGFSVQVPQHRAAEQDTAAVTSWIQEAWPHIKALPPG
ncbi:MAG TPA: winged helix-turn-helix domain-containing protein [Arthrobacter sp.]